MADPILLNDFRRQWSMIAEEVLDATRHVGESGWYVLGASVTGFEADLAGFAGRHHAVGVANGLDAIEIALRSLGLKPGQKVLTTPLSAFATTLAIYRAGGVPVYVDTDAYGLLNFDLAEQALRADPDIRFCVPVHLYGHALDLKRLAILRAEHDLHVVEDMAQALGAGWGGHPVGSAGDAAAVSFYPTKNLGALGDAGALLTDADALTAKQTIENARGALDFAQGKHAAELSVGRAGSSGCPADRRRCAGADRRLATRLRAGREVRTCCARHEQPLRRSARSHSSRRDAAAPASMDQAAARDC